MRSSLPSSLNSIVFTTKNQSTNQRRHCAELLFQNIDSGQRHSLHVPVIDVSDVECPVTIDTFDAGAIPATINAEETNAVVVQHQWNCRPVSALMKTRIALSTKTNQNRQTSENVLEN